MRQRLFVPVIVLLLATPFRAGASDDALLPALERLLTHHKRAAAVSADARAAADATEKAWGAWFPTLKLSGSYGHEEQRKGLGVSDTSAPPRQLAVVANQTLWDFGKTNGEIGKAEIAARQANTTVASVRQDLLMEGLAARINLYRSVQMLGYATQSVANIREQTGLAESRVEVGGGLPTDVLRAKNHLGDAEVRLIRARGAVVQAFNRYRAVFGEEPPGPNSLSIVAPPLDRLPLTIEDALDLASKNNLQVKMATLAADQAKVEIGRVVGAELAPKVEMTASHRLKEDYDGTMGGKQESLVMVEVSVPFNLGLSGYFSHSAAKQSAVAAVNRLDDARITVDEQVRNTWENLVMAKENAVLLRNQTKISTEFLNLARQEHMLGRRPLLDVLSGQTALYNAQADAISAEVDVSIAAFTLLRAMGNLTLESIANAN